MLSTMNLALLGGVAALLVALLVMRRSTPDGASAPSKSKTRRSSDRSPSSDRESQGKRGIGRLGRRSDTTGPKPKRTGSAGRLSRFRRGSADADHQAAVAAAQTAAVAAEPGIDEPFTGAPVEGEPDWDAMRSAMNGTDDESAPPEPTDPAPASDMDVQPVASAPDTAKWEDEELITEPGWPLPGDMDASYESELEDDLSNEDTGTHLIPALDLAEPPAAEAPEPDAPAAIGDSDSWLTGGAGSVDAEDASAEAGALEDLVWDDTPPPALPAAGDGPVAEDTTWGDASRDDDWAVPGDDATDATAIPSFDSTDDADEVADVGDAFAGALDEVEDGRIGDVASEAAPVDEADAGLPGGEGAALGHPFDVLEEADDAGETDSSEVAWTIGTEDESADASPEDAVPGDDTVVDPSRDIPVAEEHEPSDLAPADDAGDDVSTAWKSFQSQFIATHGPSHAGPADTDEDGSEPSDDGTGIGEQDDVGISWGGALDEAAATGSPAITEVEFPAETGLDDLMSWSDGAPSPSAPDTTDAFAPLWDDEAPGGETGGDDAMAAWQTPVLAHSEESPAAATGPADGGDAVAAWPASVSDGAHDAPASPEITTAGEDPAPSSDEAAERAWADVERDATADPWTLETTSDQVSTDPSVEAGPVAEAEPQEPPVAPEIAATAAPSSPPDAPVVVPTADGDEALPWWDEPTEMEMPTRVGVIPDWMRVPTDERLTGRWSLGGMAFQEGHQALSTVAYRHPLDAAPEDWMLAAQGRPKPGTVVLLVEATMNCSLDDLCVVTGEGFAPTDEGFTLMLNASAAGPFAASGTFRIVT